MDLSTNPYNYSFDLHMATIRSTREATFDLHVRPHNNGSTCKATFDLPMRPHNYESTSEQ